MGTHFKTMSIQIDTRGDMDDLKFNNYFSCGYNNIPWYNKPELDSPHDEYKKPSRKQKKKLNK